MATTTQRAQYAPVALPRGHRGGGRRRPGPLAVLLAVALILPLLVAGRIVLVSSRDERPLSGAIVVLGAAATNGEAGAVLRARLQHAQELYAAGVAPLVVTTGGVGQGQAVSEADVAADWLVRHGVPADAVVSVGTGTNTIRSLEAVAARQRDDEWGSVLLVSDPWHLYRSRLMAEDVGLTVSGTSAATEGPNVERRRRIAYNIARETVAVVAYRAGTVASRAADAVDGIVARA